MRLIFLSTAVLTGLSASAWAGINELRIDASGGTGKVTTLSIVQDATGSLGNLISNSGSGTALPVRGHWDSISITQNGSNNALSGSLKATAGSTTASLSATYTGGSNTHALTVGGTTAPANPAITVAVTGGGSNGITDTLDGSSLTYGLTLAGASNTLTNSILATGAVSLTEAITGSNNTISTTVSGGATSHTQSLTVTGSHNNITNVISGGGANSLTQSIFSDSNVVATNLTGGTQTASLSVDANSFVTYTQNSAANGSSSAVTLSNVIGAASADAKIIVAQTALATNAAATLSVNGGSFTMGTGVGAAGAYGVNVSQNSAGAILNASVAASANGYTVNITQ